MTDCDEQLERMVKSTAENINELDAEEVTDWLHHDTLDINIVCHLRSLEYKSCEVFTTIGGPGIWLDTSDARVRGSWGSSSAQHPVDYKAADMIDERVRQLFDIQKGSQ